MISIVLGSYNRIQFLKITLESIRKELEHVHHEIIIVDGGSNDGSIEWLCKQKDVITIIQHNRGIWLGKQIERKSWGYFMNLAFKCAKGKYICMVSDDCLIVPGAIINGIKLFEEQIGKGEKIGALAFYWRNWPEQKKYNVGLTLGKKMFVNHGIYLKSALNEVDYIDEETYMFYCGDGDLCLKLWEKGYKCIDSPESFIEHFSHANLEVRKTNHEKEKADLVNYLNKWQDKFYKPHENYQGGWIEKDFEDPSETAKQFSPYIKKPPLRQKVKRFLKKVIG